MSVFQVFLHHWLIEENKARKKLFYEKLDQMILARQQVQFLFDRIAENIDWTLFLMRLIINKTPTGVCHKCKSHITRFEKSRSGIVNKCQCKRCNTVNLRI